MNLTVQLLDQTNEWNLLLHFSQYLVDGFGECLPWEKADWCFSYEYISKRQSQTATVFLAS